jgi:hypothetical protein
MAFIARVIFIPQLVLLREEKKDMNENKGK